MRCGNGDGGGGGGGGSPPQVIEKGVIATAWGDPCILYDCDRRHHVAFPNIAPKYSFSGLWLLLDITGG